MPLNRLQREFEDRRHSLIETLQRNKDSLELSKQHQIYGAIKEIEVFLKAIDHQRELLLRGEDFELVREGPQPVAKRTSVAIDRLRSGTGALVRGITTVFNETVVKRTQHVVRATRHRVRLIKDVAREVKRRQEGAGENAEAKPAVEESNREFKHPPERKLK